MNTMKTVIHYIFDVITIGALLVLNVNTYAQDPCSQTTKLSGGRTISNKNEKGNTGNGYQYEIWRDGNEGELTLYNKDACFKASWNHSGNFMAFEGKSFDQTKWNDLGGDLIVNYAFEKTEEEHANYAYIGLEGWMNNAQIEWYILEDCVNDDDTVYISNRQKEVGETWVDGSVYKVWTSLLSGPGILGIYTYQIFSVRQSRRQCGTVNLSEHFRQWSKMDLGIQRGLDLLDNARIVAEAYNGKGSVTFTYATMEIVPSADSLSADTIGLTDTIPDIVDNADTLSEEDTTVTIPLINPCSTYDKHSGGNELSENKVGKTDDGHIYELWTENPAGSMTIFSGDAACAFKANWDNPRDLLAHCGYYNFSHDKKYDAYGEIVAGYNYTKSGDGGESSYIGLYGWLYNPTIEYYIVDDSYQDLSVPQDAEKLGTYELDDATYTLYKMDCIDEYGSDKNSFTKVFAVRSSARTCGIISVNKHFIKWTDLGLSIGEIYSCTIGCEVMGGMGSIEYSYANVFMDGQSILTNVSDSTEILTADNLRTLPKTTTSNEEFSSTGADVILTPNPAGNFFKVECAKAVNSIEILNLLGHALYRQDGGEMVEIHLPAGTYMVRIITADGNDSIQKLIVK